MASVNDVANAEIIQRSMDLFRMFHLELYLSQLLQLTPLFAESPVLLIVDPENPFDPNAIKVLTVKGEHLGFVPKNCTGNLKRADGIGHVAFMGAHPDSDPPLYGALVSLVPA